MDARGHHSSEIGTGSVPAPSYPNGVEYAPHARRRFCIPGGNERKGTQVSKRLITCWEDAVAFAGACALIVFVMGIVYAALVFVMAVAA